MSHPMFDSIISSNDVYLYSWQERDNTKTEFSVVKDDGEHGIKIIYFILDKGRLCSWVQVAGQGGEGGYLFEARSIFKNRDTLIRLGATTQVIDLEKAKPLEKPIGDTSFFYLVIDRRGQVQEKLFKEVKELHFDEQMQ